MIRRRVIVSGRVHGVYFRDSCRREASARGVSGWVRNRADGTVEAVFEGASADVEHMVAWSTVGPAQAVVSGVEVFDEHPERMSGFRVIA